MLSWAFRPLRFSPSQNRCREPLSHHITLALLEEKHLTMPTPMNLRAFRPRDGGIFPYGTPTYPAFLTDCVCHLLET
jgi:hypothetical protein